jgi:hypothetical protein
MGTHIVELPGTPDAPATPLSLEQTNEALILRHTHLKERLPQLIDSASKATAELRSVKGELDRIERTLKAYARIRNPRRRGRVAS